jgi:hypothetical protein
MSTFLDITRNALGAALAFMESDVVEYKGTTAICVAQESTSEILGAGGFEQHFQGFVRVAKTGFPVPVKGELLTLNGTELRIVSLNECPISWRINLEDPSR